jgi:hypothetical protein
LTISAHFIHLLLVPYADFFPFFSSLYSTAALGWAGWKVIQIARRSVRLHKTPAYILFSDPHALNKWGFLYIQFRASAYYFIIPLVGYHLIKGMFIGLGQNSGIAQAIGLILIEAAVLITASVMRPWMDKKLNSFNISIAVVNFLNAICLLIFTDVFGQVSETTDFYAFTSPRHRIAELISSDSRHS